MVTGLPPQFLKLKEDKSNKLSNQCILITHQKHSEVLQVPTPDGKPLLQVLLSAETYVGPKSSYLLICMKQRQTSRDESKSFCYLGPGYFHSVLTRML